MKNKGFKKGDIVAIPADEAREYGDKVQLVDMKGGRYRVLTDISETDVKKAQKVATVYRKDGAKLAKEAKAKADAEAKKKAAKKSNE